MEYINIVKIPITLSLCTNKMSENIKNALLGNIYTYNRE